MKNYKKNIESEIQHSQETIELAEKKIKELEESIKIEKKILERFKSLTPNSDILCGELSTKRLPSSKRIVIKYAQSHPNENFTPKDLNEYAKKVYDHTFSNSVFSWALNGLIKEGLIKKVGRGRYIYNIPKEKIDEENMAIPGD